MNKTILVIEPSVTIQKLFVTTLSRSNYKLDFITTGKEALMQIFDLLPDIVLINAEVDNPDAFEIVRIIHSMATFESLPIGLYANNHVQFDSFYAEQAKINNFSYFETDTLEFTVEELAQIPNNNQIDQRQLIIDRKEFSDEKLFSISTKLWKQDNLNNALLKSIFNMMHSWTSMDNITTEFLDLIAELCEVPLVGICIQENDGTHGYYIMADCVEKNELEDFLKVCATDFEKTMPDCSAANIIPKKLESKIKLDKFYTKDMPLSSYECEIMKDTNGKPIAVISMVRSGNFATEQMDMLHFLCNNAGLLFENALLLKQKMFYEHRIRKAFSRFVPEQIIDDLANNDSQENVSVGEKREVAILFSDIRSFTNISERNKPEVIVSFLNRYFGIMVEIIKKHGGTIDKFIGDAIMALFGTPISYEDNAKRAVEAAYEMRDALPNVPLDDLVMPEGMKFNIGIGIHYGDVIVGSIGSKDKTDYSVIGDNVNLASRLEGLTKTYGIQLLVSDTVKNSCEGSGFVFRHLDNVKVKGKAIAVPIYAVDRNQAEYPEPYRDAYKKGMELYAQAIFRLAKEYFEKALSFVPDDKASKLMISRCDELIANPPENWDGSFTFTTK